MKIFIVSTLRHFMKIEFEDVPEHEVTRGDTTQQKGKTLLCITSCSSKSGNATK